MRYKKMEVLFIHIGRHLENQFDTLLMPVGLVMLADFLTKNGIKSGVLNLSAELIENPGFDVGLFIRRADPGILAFSLHWHFQLKDVLENIKLLKREFPEKVTLAGGFTASIFHKEIMERRGHPDYIIRGDSEIPLLKLSRSVRNKLQDLNCIPNLVWKDGGGKLIINPQTYTVTQKILNGLSYANLDLIVNKDSVLKLSQNSVVLRDKDGFSYTEPFNKTIFYVAGRGCSGNCSFCGGSNRAQKLINNRTKTIYKSAESVLADIKSLLSQGIDKIKFVFDPFPNSNYYIGLFSLLEREGVSFKTNFECFGLPDKKFIRAFARTFKKDLSGSSMTISPESGSERIRKRNKTHVYTNKELLKTVSYMDAYGIRANLCFTTGLPFETKSDFQMTLAFAKHIKRLFPRADLSMTPIQIEPFSPMYIDPCKFGVTKKRTSLEDFIAQKKGSLGYRTGEMNEKEILRNAVLFRSSIQHT